MKKIIALLIMILSFTVTMSESVTAKKDYTQYVNQNILISPEKAELMIKNDKNIIMIDVRKGDAFEKAHVEGSYQVWRPAISTPTEEVGYEQMIASKERMAKLLGSYGITSETPLILISDRGEYDASKLWWALRMYGHEKMYLVDGGIDAWIKSGLPVVTGKSEKPEAKDYKFVGKEDYSRSATLEDVKAGLKDENVVIIDARSDLEHDGLVQLKGSFAKGKIPGAVHIEWDKMVNPDMTFKSRAELEKLFADNGITKDKKVIVYCFSGVRSALMTFALTELLGWENVKNYDGSWVEWSYYGIKGEVEMEKMGTFKAIMSYLTSREKMEKVITGLGAWGPVAYIVLYALITITCISVLPITIVGGLVFGPIMGVVYTAVGASIGLSLSFLIARYIARGAIEKKFGNTDAFKKINDGVKKDGWFILATTRLLPVFPFGIQNYVYGLTPISFAQYSLLSTLFILPGTSVFVMLAGAVASGDTKTATKYAIIASLIFFGLTLITKVIAKKSKKA